MYNQIKDSTREIIKTVPFFEIVFPYVKDYSSINNLNIPNSVKNDLKNNPRFYYLNPTTATFLPHSSPLVGGFTHLLTSKIILRRWVRCGSLVASS